MSLTRNINWENLMGALKRQPDSILAELLDAATAKAAELSLDLSAGRPARRMGGSNEGDNYNHRSVLAWIDAVRLDEEGDEKPAPGETMNSVQLNRFHLVNLIATLQARGVKSKKRTGTVK